MPASSESDRSLADLESRSRGLEIFELLVVVALGRGDGRVAQEIAHLREWDAALDQA